MAAPQHLDGRQAAGAIPNSDGGTGCLLIAMPDAPAAGFGAYEIAGGAAVVVTLVFALLGTLIVQHHIAVLVRQMQERLLWGEEPDDPPGEAVGDPVPPTPIPLHIVGDRE